MNWLSVVFFVSAITSDSGVTFGLAISYLLLRAGGHQTVRFEQLLYFIQEGILVNRMAISVCLLIGLVASSAKAVQTSSLTGTFALVQEDFVSGTLGPGTFDIYHFIVRNTDSIAVNALDITFESPGGNFAVPLANQAVRIGSANPGIGNDAFADSFLVVPESGSTLLTIVDADSASELDVVLATGDPQRILVPAGGSAVSAVIAVVADTEDFRLVEGFGVTDPFLPLLEIALAPTFGVIPGVTIDIQEEFESFDEFLLTIGDASNVVIDEITGPFLARSVPSGVEIGVDYSVISSLHPNTVANGQLLVTVDGQQFSWGVTATVPEPSTFALLGLVAIGLAVRRMGRTLGSSNVGSDS